MIRPPLRRETGIVDFIASNGKEDEKTYKGGGVGG